MSKEIEVKVTIKIKDEWIDKNDLAFYSVFSERSTEVIKRKLVDEVASNFAKQLTPDDLKIDLSDIKQLVKQRIIDKAAEASINALGIGDD